MDLEDQENELIALQSIYENEAENIVEHNCATDNLPGRI